MTADAATDRWIDEHSDELIATARALVQTPTENAPPTGNERDGQGMVERWLADAGAEVDVFSPAEVLELASHPAYFPTINGQPRDGHDRPNVVGRFRGAGGGRSIVLSTHIDTVPGGDPELWTVGTPFGGEVVDGRLYGRGSYDTKCAFASHLIAMRCLRELGIGLGGDVIVETVVDEEYGGSHGVLASRLRGYNADLAINSEPTHMAVCPEHRG
jgi:acetylornithine deacetylase